MRTFLQILIAVDTVFFEENERLGGLFEIENLRPLSITGPFTLLDFRLNIDEQPRRFTSARRAVIGSGIAISAVTAARDDFDLADPFADRPFGVVVADGIYARGPRLPRRANRNVFSLIFYSKTRRAETGYEVLECHAVRKDFINLALDDFFERRLLSIAEPLAVIPAFARLRILDNRQTVLGADQIGETLNRERRILEIVEFSLAIERGRVEYDVAVDVRMICVDADYKGMFTFRKPVR